MNLGAIITFIGLLLASYSVFRGGRTAVIHTFVSFKFVTALLAVGIAIVAAPLMRSLCDGGDPRRFNAAVQISGFAVLMLVVAYLVVRVGRAKLGRWSAKRLEQTAATSVVNKEWSGLRTILKRNRSSLGNLASAETLRWLFDLQFVREMTNAGDWVHLEVLAEEDPAARDRVWRRHAVNVVGRAMIDGECTLLQKAIATRFNAHEVLRPTELEESLLERTYWNPAWYMGLRAGYPLVLHAVEQLRSGKLDDAYNAATWSYTVKQGITSRWNCPAWVATKTISTAIRRTIEERVQGDEYVSDLLDILCEVVERSEYDRLLWESRKGHREYPTPFAYLIYEILNDLEELWLKTAEGGLFRATPVGRAEDAPRCKLLSGIWPFALATVVRARNAGSERFRVDQVLSYLRAVLAVGFQPYELFTREPNVPPSVLATFRDLLLNELVRAVQGKTEAVEIVCRAAAQLDDGKLWVQLGSSWLDHRLAQTLGCGGGSSGAGPTVSP